MIIEYDRMNNLIGNKNIARAMSGMFVAPGVKGFIAKHDSFLAKAKFCQDNDNPVGETKCYQMASALRLYFDASF
jgi:hypothetical protein